MKRLLATAAVLAAACGNDPLPQPVLDGTGSPTPAADYGQVASNVQRNDSGCFVWVFDQLGADPQIQPPDNGGTGPTGIHLVGGTSAVESNWICAQVTAVTATGETSALGWAYGNANMGSVSICFDAFDQATGYNIYGGHCVTDTE